VEGDRLSSTTSGPLHENLNAEPLPIAMVVAHNGAEFIGTSSVIAPN